MNSHKYLLCFVYKSKPVLLLLPLSRSLLCYSLYCFDSQLQFDAENVSRQVWYSEGIIGEPTFVPRLGYEGRDRGDEDDGYVLVQLYHPGKHLTSFCVLDAKNIEKGCIAKINLKHHVPYGFHGTFSPEVFVTPIMPLAKSKL